MTEATSTDRRRRRLTVGLLASAVVLGGGLALGPATGAWSVPGLTSSSGADNATATDETGDSAEPEPAPTVTVDRGDLIQREEANGTVGHGDSWPLPVRAEGVVTESPEKGALIDPGEVLLRVDGKPVYLAQGETPLYRELRYMANAKDRLKGPDVTQLQQFLLDAGFDDKGRLEADGELGRSTERAIKAWQKDVGLQQTGVVDRTQMVFSPTAVRIESAPRLGADFDQLTVTDAAQKVTAGFDTKLQAFVPEGGAVTLEVSPTDTVDGRITDVSTKLDESGNRQLDVTIIPDEPLPEGIDRIKVTATRTAATDTLLVQVRALLALAGGGYALEVVTPEGPELRRVELGPVAEDVAAISGDVDEGDDVIVPRQVGGES